MSEENKEAAAAQANATPTGKAPIPIAEQSVIHRKIPRAVFFDDAEAWVDKYGEDELFSQMQELH